MNGLTQEQLVLFAILGALVVLLVWARWRHDVVAFAALIAAVLAGLVPASEAFAGFGHPATITVALVLVVSRILAQSGATEYLARVIRPLTDRTWTHAGALSAIGAALSGFMNNVGALALLMPLAIETAKKVKRAPGLLLMPLSFGTILGGLLTLIGTPPNIIVASFRAQRYGESFAVFDFTPVGGAVALAGLAFLTLVGWRLVPERRGRAADASDLFDIESYLAEGLVVRNSAAAGKTVRELQELAGDVNFQIAGLTRRGKLRAPVAAGTEIRAGDRVLLEVGPEEIEKLVGALGLKLGKAKESRAGLLTSDDTEVMEVLVPTGAELEGRTAGQAQFVARFGINLLGVSRQGRRYRGRLRSFRFQRGDVLLLHGDSGRLAEAVSHLGLLPLASRGLSFGLRAKAPMIIGLFAAAIVLASTGVLPIAVALGLAIVAMVMSGLVPARGLYEGIDWPVIVLLGSLIPVGGAMQTTGATDLLSGMIVSLSTGVPAAVLLAALLVLTMTLSDILNNNATAIVMAPVAVGVAEGLEVNPDAFLMAVAVGASCAFLTPIGHQNNALVMGPGGYRFGDYWRLGLPLEVLILAVSVPMILLVWPL